MEESRDAEKEALVEVHEHVTRAAAILRSLGAEYERVSWMLEDTLTYLRPDEVMAEFDDTEELALLKGAG
jgi:hypothetical protein